MFEGWAEFPPTNILVQALVNGFMGPITPTDTSDKDVEIPPGAMEAMQRSAMAEIATKAGNRLPILRGRDKGLPKTPPILDVEGMRQKNEEAVARLRRHVA